MIDSSDEEEYEIETIVDHKRERGRSTKLKYLIKWKGYDDEDSTWESEDNIRAPVLLEEYWKAKGGPAARENARISGASKRKRQQPQDSQDDDQRAMPPPPAAPSRRQRQSRGRIAKYKGHDVIIDGSYPPNGNTIDWETEAASVEHVSPQNPQNNVKDDLEAVVRWNDGKYSLHPCALLHKKCPIKLLQYYERILEFNHH